MKTLEKGDTVYFQNEPANSVYFLKEGKIRISKFSQEGEEFLYAILEKGEVFGEASIINATNRQEAAIVEEKGTYCMMKEEKFKELLLRSPSLNLKFSQMLEDRLLKVQNRLQDLTLKNNQQRIIDFLKDTASMYSKGSNGDCIINSSLTQQKIAQLTATNRREVSSLFSRLKKNRIIDYNRKLIKIVDHNKLSAY